MIDSVNVPNPINNSSYDNMTIYGLSWYIFHSLFEPLMLGRVDHELLVYGGVNICELFIPDNKCCGERSHYSFCYRISRYLLG